MVTGKLPDPVNILATSSRSTFATGKVYAIQCGWDEWFLAQVTPDATVAMSQTVISGAHLAAWRKKKPATIDLGPIKFRAAMMKGAPSYGKWILIGIYPLPPELDNYSKRGRIGYDFSTDERELELYYLDDQHVTSWRVPVSEYDGREVHLYHHQDALIRWLLDEPVMLRALGENHWRAPYIDAIYDDPEKFELYKKLVPRVLAESERYPKEETWGDVSY
ncbi:hypothetical protein PbB2_02410 [Candidatus Phycosocius bacilliformis]|uniref:Uncharacterized protein n=1 Tax=Candidatus Phycosocius bacilliformis TaxID=1445552 RepID=A0A2P2ECD2_9PROT|nr:hypothetical protein [Candidatus Phycosocius bacilliformis]GBF58722.1 hypothetical protein PbB2_02410 [Candidatus Phycosocius bacilliformis]